MPVQEFMIATDMTTGGSVEERLRWAFKMYDEDGSGKIDRQEMEEIISTLFELNGICEVRHNIMQRPSTLVMTIQKYSKEAAMRLFCKLDVNKTGEVSEEDFIRGCLADHGLCYTISNANKFFK